MAYHVTVILTNGSKSHFHSEDGPMYDHAGEGVLVIDDITGATISFVGKNLLAWITTEMTADEVHEYKQIIEDRNNGVRPESEGGLDDGDGRVGV